MDHIPFNMYNHFLVNVKFHVFKLKENFRVKFSFLEYVKSQMHHPLVVYLNNRNHEDYKEVYLSLTNPSHKADNEAFYRVVRYFYRDIYSSLVNIGGEGDFILDLECLEFLGLDFKTLDGSFNDKLVKLNNSSVSNELILWRWIVWTTLFMYLKP